MKKKVIISACLLGHLCRYDGKTKKSTHILDAFSEYEIIPFCPEAPLFGTPRQRISVISKNHQNQIITDNTNEDVTQRLEDEIQRFIADHPTANTIVLKSKSPSCGVGSTPILDENRNKLHLGDGIAGWMFKKHYKNAVILDEGDI